VTADRHLSVLIATPDDDRASQLQQVVRSRTTWTVKRARAGDSALRGLAGTPPALALVDAELPVISCEEFAYLARRRALLSNIAIVIVEFNRMEKSRESSVLLAGADEYVDGTSLAGFWARVQTVLLRRRRRGESHAIGSTFHRVDGLYVDIGRSFVSVDGSPIVMQPLEFALLQYFLERKNCLITRDELWQAVWHKDGPVRSRTIDVHVCRLRHRLGSASRRIQTLVRRGYRLVVSESDG
jgi:DNA-binding response OmpR family regulator